MRRGEPSDFAGGTARGGRPVQGGGAGPGVPQGPRRLHPERQESAAPHAAGPRQGQPFSHRLPAHLHHPRHQEGAHDPGYSARLRRQR